MAEERMRTRQNTEEEQTARKEQDTKPAVSETWAEETIADLDEFIESQGIYIRQ